jgi:anti-sigma-K factor RskA
MSAMNHIDHDDLALFAMQLLSSQEDAAVRQHLATCSECRQALGEIQGDLAILATSVDMHSPAALTRERLLNQISHEPRQRAVERPEQELASRREDLPTSSSRIAAVPVPVPVSSGKDRDDRVADKRFTESDAPRPVSPAARLAPWLGWAVAAGVAIMAGNYYHENQVMRSTLTREHAQLDRLTLDAASARSLLETLQDPSATRVTLTRSKQAPVPQGKVTYVADKGSLLFVASNMEPLQTYKTYELWLIPADGRDPIPAGTFQPDARGNASIVLPKLPPGTAAKAFGITIEDQGGSRTPTMPIIMAGAAGV